MDPIQTQTALSIALLDQDGQLLTRDYSTGQYFLYMRLAIPETTVVNARSGSAGLAALRDTLVTEFIATIDKAISKS